MRTNREGPGWLHDALDALCDATAMIGVDGSVQRLSDGAAALTGWRPEEALGRHVAEVLPLELAGDVHPAVLAAATGTRQDARGVCWLTDRAGTRAPVHVVAAPIRGEGDAVAGAVIALHPAALPPALQPNPSSAAPEPGRSAPATDPSITPEMIRGWNAEISAVYDSTPAVMLLLDRNRRVRRANAAAAEMAGEADAATLAGRMVGAAVRCLNALENPEGCGVGPECSTCSIREAVNDTLESGRPYLNFEASLPIGPEASRGSAICLISTTRLQSADDPLVLTSILDITQRRATEDRLHTQAAVLDQIGDAVTITDLAGSILFVNEAQVRAAGIPRAQLIGSPVTVFGEDPALGALHREIIEHTVATGAWHGDVANRVADGTSGIREVRTTLIRNTDGEPVGICGIATDVTHARRTAQQVRASEQIFSTAFHASPAIKMIVRVSDSRIVDVNDAFEQATGYRRDESVGRQLGSDLALWADPTRWQRALAQLHDGTGIRNTEQTLRNRSGQEFTVLLSANLVEIRGETCVLAAAIDVSERKRSEEQLAAELLRRRMLFDGSPDGLAVLDPRNGRFIEFNAAAHEHLGYSREQFARMTVLDIEALETPEQTAERIREVMRKGRIDFETAHRTASFEIRNVLVTAQVLEAEGQIAYLCTFRDITSLKAAEARVRESEERYRRLFDEAAEGVLIADARDGMILDCNQAFLTLVGYERAELIGKHGSILHPPDPDTQGGTIRLAPHGNASQGAARTSLLQTQCGELREVEIRDSRIVLGGREVVQAMYHDVTDERRLQVERETTLDLLQRLNDPNQTHELIQSVTRLLHEWTGCDAVGVRLACEDDYPYFETRGFPAGFVRLESQLCHRCPDGAALRDASGAVVLDCMCGNVLQGRFDPAMPFFSERGSFWTNSTSALLASTSDADRQARTRNRCNGEGYESVALIPLRHAGETLGLLQMNDRRRDRFTPGMITFLELLADQIAVALAQRQAQAALQASEERLQLAVTGGQVGVWDLDLATGRMAWRAEHQRLFGIEPDGSQGTLEAFEQIVHPADRARVRAAIDRAAACAASFDEEFRVATPDGSIRWLHGQGTAVRTTAATAGRLLGVIRDITARREAEEAVRRSEARLRQAQAAASIGCYHHDLVTGVRWQSDELWRLLGLEPSDTPVTDMWPYVYAGDAESVNAAVTETLARHTELDIEHRIVRADGRVRHVRLRGKVDTDAAGTPLTLAGTVQDVTESVTLEAQLRQAQKMESVGRLAGGVAHDFNNMLQVILGNAELAQGTSGLSDPVREYLREIEGAAERSADLVRRLLAFARRQTVQPEILALDAMVAGMRGILERMVGEDIDLRVVCSDDQWSARIDPSQIDQILANLVVNARDAVDRGGAITIETGAATLGDAYCAAHVGAAAGDYVVLAVTDTGSGMDAATVAHVFEPFFTTKPKDKGTGLGLAVVYGIVKQNNGYIDVSSEVGHGTTVCIYLPRHPSSPPNPQAGVGQAGDLEGSETVLLSESEEGVLRLASMMLEAHGYTVLSSREPEEIVRLAGEHEGPIHLLLTDTTGGSLCTRVAAQRPGIRSILLCASSPDGPTRPTVLDGSVNLLQKPFATAALLRKVRSVLDA